MQFIDTHCHLTREDDSKIEQIIASANEHHVQRLICIGASEGIDSSKRALQIAKQHENIWCTIGIHPHDAKDFTDLSQLEELIGDSRVVAVGETGLDFYRDWAPKENQVKLFKNTIQLAKKFKKPLVIHCRDAAGETLSILQEEEVESIGGVFHCYAEDADFAKELAKINFLVSFTGNLTFKKTDNLRVAAKEIPLEQIMLETDTPYMAPEPFRGKPSEPKHVLEIAKRLAEIKQVELEHVAKVTSNNAEKLFSIKNV